MKTIDKIILSHAHGDHTGGLRDVLKKTKSPEVIAHPAIWKPKYKKETGKEMPVYNGIPFAREEIEKYGRFTLSSEPVQISESIITTGEVSRITDFETLESSLLVKQGETFNQYDYPDDPA